MGVCLPSCRCWVIIELNGIPGPTFAVHSVPTVKNLYGSDRNILNLAVDIDMSLTIIEM